MISSPLHFVGPFEFWVVVFQLNPQLFSSIPPICLGLFKCSNLYLVLLQCLGEAHICGDKRFCRHTLRKLMVGPASLNSGYMPLSFSVCRASATDWLNSWVAYLTFIILLRSEEHTSELQSHSDLVCRLLLEKKKQHFSLPYVNSAVFWRCGVTHYVFDCFYFWYWLIMQ